jgi:hypothetical protein
MKYPFLMTIASGFAIPVIFVFQKVSKFNHLSWLLAVFSLATSITWLSFSAGLIVDVIKVNFQN